VTSLDFRKELLQDTGGEDFQCSGISLALRDGVLEKESQAAFCDFDHSLLVLLAGLLAAEHLPELIAEPLEEGL